MTSPSDWSHGYFTGTLYTSGFYREMAPNCMDLAALIRGHRPPRLEGQPFHYLELGSGMGLNLCLLAAAYPEGDFVGVDFHADQIAHSLRLKEDMALGNVHFLQADVLDLIARNGNPLQPRSFNYVACHGLFTWVAPEVQEALMQMAHTLLVIGGIFYLSANIQPGWLAGSAFQHLAEGERMRFSKAQSYQAYQRTMQLMGQLVGPSPDQSSPLGHQLPALRNLLDANAGYDPTYVLHEFANPHWKPLWVDDLHARLMGHQLRFLGSATLPELFFELLPSYLRELVAAEPERPRQELLIDLALCRQFRRDLYVLGFDPLPQAELQQRLSSVRLQLLTDLRMDPMQFHTSYGVIGGDPAVFAAMGDRLEQGSASLEELGACIGRDRPAATVLAALALNAGWLGLDREGADPRAADTANAALLAKPVVFGKALALASPNLGSACAIPMQMAILLKLRESGLAAQHWAGALKQELALMGQQLQAGSSPQEGTATEEPRADEASRQTKLAAQAVEEFQTKTIPMLKRAGVLPLSRPRVDG